MNVLAAHFYNRFSFRTILLLIWLAEGACSKKSASPTPPPPPPNGDSVVISHFKVTGAKILDTNNVEFVARGVNVNGPFWPWPRPTVPDANLIIDTWKCNIVRVNCWPLNPPYPNTNNADLDGIVKAFTSRKVVAMLEDHDFTGSYPDASGLSALTTWWTTQANKYKSNPYVWFNIMNEPGGSGDVPADWFNAHDAVIKAIRATGAQNIIVCDEHAFGQANGFPNNASSGALTYGPRLTQKYSNIVFSLHLYGAWVYSEQRLKDYIDAVHAKNLAVIIGEYGAGPDISTEVATSLFKVALPGHVGRIVWHWDGSDEHRLVTGTQGGWAIDDVSGSKPGNLSFVGNLVWLDNHGQLTISDPGLVPPPLLAYNLDFEKDNPQAGAGIGNGWINFGTTTFDNTAGNVKQGSFSAKVDPGQAGGFGQTIYLAPGGSYKLTAWGKHSVTASAITNIGIKGQTDPAAAETDFGSLSFTENSFQEKSVVITVPSQLSEVFLYVYKNDPSPAFWCDDIRIEKQ